MDRLGSGKYYRIPLQFSATCSNPSTSLYEPAAITHIKFNGRFSRVRISRADLNENNVGNAIRSSMRLKLFEQAAWLASQSLRWSSVCSICLLRIRFVKRLESGIFIFNSLNMARFSRFWFTQNASKFLHVMDHLGGELKGPSNSSPCAFSRKQELEGKKGLAVWQLEWI